jgi:hypothetical protein
LKSELASRIASRKSFWISQPWDNFPVVAFTVVLIQKRQSYLQLEGSSSDTLLNVSNVVIIALSSFGDATVALWTPK